MDARSRKHSEITQTVYDLPPIFTCVIATENRALAPDEWDVADRATQRAAAAAAAATHPRESECTLPTTTRPASEPSSVHAPNTLPPGLTPRSHRLPGSRLCRSQHAPPGHIRSPGLVFCLLLVEHLRDLVSEDRCGIVRPHAYPRTVTSAISSPPRELGPAPALQQGRNQYTHADATAEKTRRATPPIMSQRIKSLKSGGGGGDGAGHFGAPPYGHVLQVVAIVVPAG